MRTVLEYIFWASVAAVAYAYPVYPALIYALSRVFGRQDAPPLLPESALPVVSLLIAAHNEETVIEQRIRNALELNYPIDKIEIVIASDGSDDGTVEMASRYGRRVRVLNYEQRQGKAATLNASIQQLRGDIILLSDANTWIQPLALRNLVRWFTDPSVGAVCGRLVLIDPMGGANVDSLYWRYETFLKKCEGKLGALLGANGAIYALRRDVFRPIPTQTIVDDMVIPLLAKRRTGCSLIYDAQAIGWEETPAHLRDEFNRRIRIGAGGFQAIGLLWPLLNPRQGWIAFTFLSHKILRWTGPFFLIGALASSAALCPSGWFFRWALIGQAGFYGMSAALPLIPQTVGLPRGARLATMFSGMNLALLLGFIRWTKGIQTGKWQRTQRTPMRKAA